MKSLGIGLGVEMQCFDIGFWPKSLGLDKKVLFTSLFSLEKSPRVEWIPAIKFLWWLESFDCCTIACSNGHTDMDSLIDGNLQLGSRLAQTEKGRTSIDNVGWLQTGSHADGRTFLGHAALQHWRRLCLCKSPASKNAKCV
jgi:hypothetical protein